MQLNPYTCVLCRETLQPTTKDNTLYKQWYGTNLVWEDERGLFFCIDDKGDYIQRHRPSEQALMQGLDSILSTHALT